MIQSSVAFDNSGLNSEEWPPDIVYAAGLLQQCLAQAER